MDFDSRYISVDVAGDANRLWAIFRAVEKTALRIAQDEGWDLRNYVLVRHTSGTFRRDSVDAAQETAVSNGFETTNIELGVDKYSDDVLESMWVKASAKGTPPETVRIEVLHGGELAVNGVFTQLKQAAEAVPMAPPAPEPTYVPVAVPPETQSLWQRAVNHPWVAGVGASLLATGILAVAVAWFK